LRLAAGRALHERGRRDRAETLELIRTGQELDARQGITTAQEGATMKQQRDLLRLVAARGLLEIDVVALLFITEIDEIFAGRPPVADKEYPGRLRIGGVKIVSDGSPQGKTSWFTTPYLTGGPTGEQNWRGEPSFPQPELTAMVEKVYEGGAPLFVHVNGDAAIDAFLEALEAITIDGARAAPSGWE
jgi:predicted amidohydrolase YtcJ